jgi:hypothetical protein
MDLVNIKRFARPSSRSDHGLWGSARYFWGGWLVLGFLGFNHRCYVVAPSALRDVVNVSRLCGAKNTTVQKTENRILALGIHRANATLTRKRAMVLFTGSEDTMRMREAATRVRVWGRNRLQWGAREGRGPYTARGAGVGPDYRGEPGPCITGLLEGGGGG